MSKYLMWGVIPVVYDKYGSWSINSRKKLVRFLLSGVVRFLAAINRLVELAFMDRIPMNIPLVPHGQSKLPDFINKFKGYRG